MCKTIFARLDPWLFRTVTKSSCHQSVDGSVHPGWSRLEETGIQRKRFTLINGRSTVFATQRALSFIQIYERIKLTRYILKGSGNHDDGYSAFEATSSDLTRYLRIHDVTTLFITGLATDYCIKRTALDATKNGFEVYVMTTQLKRVDCSNNGDGDSFRGNGREQDVIWLLLTK